MAIQLSDVEIKEYGVIKLRSPVLIEGLPDVGLVGVITTSFLVEKIDLELYGHVETSLLPPVMVLHNSRLLHPVRLYASRDGGLVVLTSEIALPPNAYHPLIRALVDWMLRVRVSRVISVNGYPVPNRLDLVKPEVFGVANSTEALEYLKKYNISIMEEGFVAGFYALLLRESQRYGVPGVALLSQSFARYPDPGAAASVVEKLSEMLGKKIDVRPLLEKADELKLSLRDLMKQTEEAIRQSSKVLEGHLPAMYR